MQQRYLVRAHETAAGEQTQGPPQAQENQSLKVWKKVQLGDSSPDALSQYSTLYKKNIVIYPRTR